MSSIVVYVVSEFVFARVAPAPPYPLSLALERVWQTLWVSEWHSRGNLKLAAGTQDSFPKW